MNRKKVVIIGGGTGTMAVVTGLKKYPELDISVIVSMTDDGGSNAVIRDEFGILPLSDLRKSIIALAEDGNKILRDIFTYRFDKGNGLTGHTLGNLIMLGLSDISGSELGAIAAASELFHLKGKVIPVTLEKASLVAQYDDGTVITSEHLIDEPEEDSSKKIVSLKIEPQVSAYHGAIDAILNADFILAGPGDLYTTTLANIIVEGIGGAIKNSRAKLIFINNLMTKKGQTHWMKSSDLISEFTKYSGRSPDAVLINDRKIPEEILKKYQNHGEQPIEDDLGEESGNKIIRSDFIYGEEIIKDKGDILRRSLIRHDHDKLARALLNIFSEFFAYANK